MVDCHNIEPVMYQIIRVYPARVSEHYSPCETSLLARIILRGQWLHFCRITRQNYAIYPFAENVIETDSLQTT